MKIIRYKATSVIKNGANGDFIRPWPCIRYKARGGFVLDTRPWPYNRGNTVSVYKHMQQPLNFPCLYRMFFLFGAVLDLIPYTFTSSPILHSSIFIDPSFSSEHETQQELDGTAFPIAVS